MKVSSTVIVIVRAVRSKKYMDCANWDESVKLGTVTHYTTKSTLKVLRETRPESHVTVDISIFIFGNIFVKI